MRFTTTLAGVAAVAAAIKIQDAEVYSSGPQSFNATVTVHCYDCEFEASYEEPAQGSTVDVAEYKEWVWCRDPIHNEENWFWSGVDCVDRWDEEDYSYYLFSGCSNCIGDECHECDWYSMADDQIWMDDYQEGIYCEAPEFDDYYWSYSSDNCSNTFDEDVYNHYCDSCSCGELSDGSYSCDWCWYCIEGEEDIYGQQDQAITFCDYAWFDDWSGAYYGSLCVDYADAEDWFQKCTNCQCESYPMYNYDSNGELYLDTESTDLYCPNCEMCEYQDSTWGKSTNLGISGTSDSSATSGTSDSSATSGTSGRSATFGTSDGSATSGTSDSSTASGTSATSTN